MVPVVKIGTKFLSTIRDKVHCICTLKMFRRNRKLNQWLNSTSEHHTKLNSGNQTNQCEIGNCGDVSCRLQLIIMLG